MDETARAEPVDINPVFRAHPQFIVGIITQSPHITLQQHPGLSTRPVHQPQPFGGTDEPAAILACQSGLDVFAPKDFSPRLVLERKQRAGPVCRVIQVIAIQSHPACIVLKPKIGHIGQLPLFYPRGHTADQPPRGRLVTEESLEIDRNPDVSRPILADARHRMLQALARISHHIKKSESVLPGRININSRIGAHPQLAIGGFEKISDEVIAQR